MEIELKKKDVANSQLNWAIRLFIDYQAYVPAITLAAAAEEILSKTLGQKSSHHKLKITLSNILTLPENDISDNYLNKTKNLFKHWSEPTQFITLDIQTEALQYVIRALANMIGFDQSLPAEGPRFMEWLKNNRQDLLPEDFARKWEETRSRLESSCV